MKNITAAYIRQVKCTGVTVNVLGAKMPNTDTLDDILAAFAAHCEYGVGAVVNMALEQ